MSILGADRIGKLARWMGAAALALILALVVLLFPRLKAIYELHYTYESIYQVFSVDLQRSDALARVLALVVSSVIGFAWIPLLVGTGFIFTRRIGRQWYIRLAGVWVAWFTINAAVPLLHATLGSRICMKRDGTTDKWFAREPNTGRILLYDSPGTDDIGPRRQATPDVCFRWALQEGYISSREPKPVVYSSGLQFFSSTTNDPVLWYYRQPGGDIELFDSGGYHNGEALLPITKAIVTEFESRSKEKLSDKAPVEKLSDKAPVEKLSDKAPDGGRACRDRRMTWDADVNMCSDREARACEQRGRIWKGADVGCVQNDLERLQRQYERALGKNTSRDQNKSPERRAFDNSPEGLRVQKQCAESHMKYIGRLGCIEDKGAGNGRSAPDPGKRLNEAERQFLNRLGRQVLGDTTDDFDEGQSAWAPADETLDFGVVHKTLLPPEGRSLNPGGKYHIRVHEVVPGECVDVYDRNGMYLGDDCGGFLSLAGRWPEKYVPKSGHTVEVTYVLCPQQISATRVAEGCQ